MKLVEGKNCWRISKAQKARLLIDGEEYFSQFRRAAIAAQYRILITAWDIDSHVRLVRSTEDDGYPQELGDLLLSLLKKNKKLHIYILLWDFSMIYAFERDWSPVFNYTDWRRHPRLHLIMDGNHPPAASHHQKIVTIDQSVAFVGGFDLSKWRWDTSNHEPDDKRRIDPGGDPYPPFHDVQFMVSGPVVKDLNDLFFFRWRLVTGTSLSDPHRPLTDNEDSWPSDKPPEFQNITMGITRTLYNDDIIKETEQCHIDAIRSARDLIYIENQYLSSSLIGNQLIKSLKSPKGPEIVIVLPRMTGGWLEQMTMDVLRDRIIYLLEKADRNQRLRIFYPQIADDDNLVLSVHSKLFIIDDKILKVGSSNLSNRSMSLDSECDLIILSDGNQKISSQIQQFRHRLLSEHLGVTRQKYEEIEKKAVKMIQAIDEANHGKRRLVTLDHNISEEEVKNIAKITIVDPEHPVEPDKLIDHFIGKTSKQNRRQNVKKFLAILSGLVIIAVTWSFTPLGDLLDEEIIASWLTSADNPLISHMIYGVLFTFLAVIGIPVTVLIGGIGILFGPLSGSLLAMIASISSAVLSYLLGQITGKNFIRSFAGEKINSISKRLAKKGILTMIFLRIVPVAPYAVINMLAGASHIRFRDYLLGTMIGMIPGILILTSFFGQLVQVLSDATTENVLILIGLLVLFLILFTVGFKYISQNTSK